MDMIFTAVSGAFSPVTLGANFAGTLVGMIVGALPGLGSVVAISICLPFT